MRTLVQASRRDLAVAGAVVAWVPAVLVMDRGVGGWGQRGLGLASWLLLLVLLRGEDGRTRAQVVIVVGYATAVEYACSPLLGVYTYRLHNVPAFVPPGHGLVYLAALALGRCALLVAVRRPAIAVTLAAGAGYALWGLLASPRLDVLGAVWFGCLVVFALRGRAPLVYVAAFAVVTYLELLGTALGTWTWAAHDPTGIIAIGNPPSGVPGGYCFFDAAAMTLAPLLLRLARAVRPTRAALPVRVAQPSSQRLSSASQASLRSTSLSFQCSASSLDR